MRVCVLKGGLSPQHYTNTPVEATASQATPSRALPCKLQPVASLAYCGSQLTTAPRQWQTFLPERLSPFPRRLRWRSTALCASADHCRGRATAHSSAQGCQGGGGESPTRAPRPATRGKISDPRPAAPSDPCRPARPGPDICQKPSPARTFVYSGVTIYIFDTDSRAMFLVKR